MKLTKYLVEDTKDIKQAAFVETKQDYKATKSTLKLFYKSLFEFWLDFEKKQKSKVLLRIKAG